MSEIKPIDDNFGAKQLLADICKNAHLIDIRVRMDGEYYWFEGDYLEHILPHLEYRQIDNGGIKATLDGHKQLPEVNTRSLPVEAIKAAIRALYEARNKHYEAADLARRKGRASSAQVSIKMAESAGKSAAALRALLPEDK